MARSHTSAPALAADRRRSHGRAKLKPLRSGTRPEFGRETTDVLLVRCCSLRSGTASQSRPVSLVHILRPGEALAWGRGHSVAAGLPFVVL